MRFRLLLLFITFSCLIQAQEIELKSLKNKIDSIDILISQNEQKIKIISQENNKLLEKKKIIVSQRNEILTKNEIGEIYVCTSGTFLYEMPNGTKDIVNLAIGDRVKVLETKDNNCRVLFKGIKGWVWKIAIESELSWNLKIQKDEEAARLIKIEEEKTEQIRIANKILFEKEQKNSAEKRKKDQQIAIAKRIQAEKEERIEIEKRRSSLIEKYGSEIGLKIFEKRIWIGMTKTMLIESWGTPSDINRSVGAWGIHEQCVYYNANVYVENDKVTSWQD